MPHPSWNDSYASGDLPWDTDTPDPMLVQTIESQTIAPGRTLEVGCGTGTNAIYLAQHGFDVVGIDISPLAVEKARAKAHGRCRFEAIDFLHEAAPGGPFQFVFDRGCFHTFDEDHERARFAQNVASALVDAGDVIQLREGSRKNEAIKMCLDTAKGRGVPSWLELDADNFRGSVKQLPARDEIQLPIQEQLIVELYSK